MIVGFAITGPLCAAPPQTSDDTGAEHVLLTNGNVAGQAIGVIVGSGVDLGDGVVTPEFIDENGYGYGNAIRNLLVAGCAM